MTAGPPTSQIWRRSTPTRNVLSGGLAETPLAETVQFLASLRKTGTLALEDPASGRSGSLGFIDGRVVHAVCPPVVGEPAFHRLLAWRQGRYLFLADAAVAERSIQADVGSLLLDGMRRLDDRERAAARLPAASTVLYRRRDARLLDQPLTALDRLALDRIDGLATVGALIDEDPDPEMVTRLADLVARGFAIQHPDRAWLHDLVLARTPLGDERNDAQAEDTAARILATCEEPTTLAALVTAAACADEEAVAAARYLVALGLVQVVGGDHRLLAL
jgi:hypothetical protein